MADSVISKVVPRSFSLTREDGAVCEVPVEQVPFTFDAEGRFGIQSGPGPSTALFDVHSSEDQLVIVRRGVAAKNPVHPFWPRVELQVPYDGRPSAILNFKSATNQIEESDTMPIDAAHLAKLANALAVCQDNYDKSRSPAAPLVSKPLGQLIDFVRNYIKRLPKVRGEYENRMAAAAQQAKIEEIAQKTKRDGPEQMYCNISEPCK